MTVSSEFAYYEYFKLSNGERTLAERVEWIEFWNLKLIIWNFAYLTASNETNHRKTSEDTQIPYKFQWCHLMLLFMPNYGIFS